MNGQVLFIDDEEHLRIAAAQTFDLADIACTCCASAEEALSLVGPDFDGVIVSDIRMPEVDGITLMRRALRLDSDLPVILLTGHGDVDLAVACVKEGAYDFLEKPCEPARLVATVKRALDRRRLTLENRALRAEVGSQDVIRARLTGRSDAIQMLRKHLSAIAKTDADVLIVGATGTGKEVAARALHRASARAQKPFVQVNCAALPEAMMESELFGIEAGAFPGASRARAGKLEHARGGILCLDEVDSLPIPLQAKLLDVLHNRVITRLGSNDPIKLDLRVIALSKTDLEAEVAAGRFRADLYYRLNVVSVTLPALDDRKEDIPALFALLVTESAQRYGVDVPAVPEKLMAQLVARNWPGNVRELRNAAERLVLGLDVMSTSDATSSPANLAEMMAAHEKTLIAAAIAANGGRLKETYESLGLSRKTLYDKMQKYGLNRDDYVSAP